MDCILLWSSAVRVHESQAYRKMDVTRERISRILELREILLSFQKWFQPCQCCCCLCCPGASVITEPRYLKLVNVSSFCPLTLNSVLMPLELQLGLLGTDLHYCYCCLPIKRRCQVTSKHAYTVDPTKSVWVDYAAVQA